MMREDNPVDVRDSFLERMQTMLERWHDNLKFLEGEEKYIESGAKLSYNQQLHALVMRHQALVRKLEFLPTAGPEQQAEIREELEIEMLKFEKELETLQSIAGEARHEVASYRRWGMQQPK
jgi:hypothetical protein